MLKLAGIFLIILAGTGLGGSCSFAFTKRENALEEIRKMVLLLRGEIRCGSASLYDCLTGTAEKMHGECRAFLFCMAENVRECQGQSFGQIFRESAGEFSRKQGLSPEETEKFCSMGACLGHLDLEMQLKQLALYEEELKLHLEEVHREFPGKRKLCRSLGIFGGIFLAVLVW